MIPVLLLFSALFTSAGEPPGPVETLGGRECALLELLENPDPEARRQAARALREFDHSRVRKALLRVLDREPEPFEVKKEAVKSLSRKALHREVRDRLSRLVDDPEEPISLRATAQKALYLAAHKPEVQGGTVVRLVNPFAAPELRRAAAWALHRAALEPHAKANLLKVALDENAPEDLRVEAWRSLYRAVVGDASVRAQAIRTSASSPKRAVRAVATRALVGVAGRADARAHLARLVRSEPDPEVRGAAALVQAGRVTPDLAREFRVELEPRRPLDPIENE